MSLSVDVIPRDVATETHCFKRYVSYGEEPEFAPALRVYLSGCNFRCRFCNVAPDCFVPDRGTRVVPEELARECEAALESGVRTINLLGGEPSLNTRTILQLAAAARKPLPLMLNTNGFFTSHTRESLRSVIHTWLVDFKFGNDDCAARLAGACDYLATITPNLEALAAGARLHIRHLLMPGHLECCFLPVVDWLCVNIPGARFHLMTGYVPGWRAVRDATLGRLLPRADVQRALAHLRGANLVWSSDSHG